MSRASEARCQYPDAWKQYRARRFWGLASMLGLFLIPFVLNKLIGSVLWARFPDVLVHLHPTSPIYTCRRLTAPNISSLEKKDDLLLQVNAPSRSGAIREFGVVRFRIRLTVRRRIGYPPGSQRDFCCIGSLVVWLRSFCDYEHTKNEENKNGDHHDIPPAKLCFYRRSWWRQIPSRWTVNTSPLLNLFLFACA
jgi:hypothetical protein